MSNFFAVLDDDSIDHKSNRFFPGTSPLKSQSKTTEKINSAPPVKHQQQQQTAQYTQQQMQYFAQQQQLQFFQQYAAWLTLPQPKFQDAISKYSPEQQQYWWAQYRAYQTYAQQYQYQVAAAAYSQLYYGQVAQYQQQQLYYATVATGVQASMMSNYQVQYAGYQASPQMTGKQEDKNQMMQNEVVANNPVIQSSPVVNTNSIIASSIPTTQTPVISVNPEPEVPVSLEIPALRRKESHQPVVPNVEPPAAPKIEIVPPKPSRNIIIKDNFGNEVNVAFRWSHARSELTQPVAKKVYTKVDILALRPEGDFKADLLGNITVATKDKFGKVNLADRKPANNTYATPPADESKTAGDRPKEAVAGDSVKAVSSKLRVVEPLKPAATATVDRAIPDLLLNAARPERVTAPPGLPPPGMKKEGSNNWENYTTSSQAAMTVAGVSGLGLRLSHTYSELTQPVAKKVYTKVDILALRPEGDFKADLLGNITVPADGDAGHSKGDRGGTYANGRGRGGGVAEAGVSGINRKFKQFVC